MTSRIITSATLTSPKHSTFLPVPALPVSGYVGHFDASNLPYADGAKVPQLRNLNGSLPIIGQSTAAIQPTIGTENGFRHVDSAGVNAILFNTTSITALPQPLTQVVVARVTTVSSAALLGANPNCNVGVNLGNWFMNAGSTITGGAVSTSAWVVIVGVINGASSTLSVNGVRTTGNAGTNTMAHVRLWSSDTVAYLQARIRKAAIYPFAMTSAQIDQTTAYLMAYYGL